MTQPEQGPDIQNNAQTEITKISIQSRWAKTTILLAGLAIMSAPGASIGFTLGSALTSKQIRNQSDNSFETLKQTYESIFGKPQFEPLDPNSLNTKTEIAAENINFATELWLFNQNTANLNGAFNEFAQRPNTENSLEVFHQIAVDHLFKGLRLLNKAAKRQVAEYLNADPGQLQVKLDGQIYDLNNSFQFQTAFALTSLKLEAIAIQMDLNNIAAEEKRAEVLAKSAKNILDQEILLWLKNQNLNNGFTKDSLLLIEPQSLSRFARTLKLIDNLGYPPPRAGIFGPDAKYGGRFVAKGELSSEHTTIDYGDRYGSINSLIHELGHYLAEVSKETNPEFSQSAFNKLLDQVERENLPTVANKETVHFYTPPDYRINRTEQYAYYFEEFVNNGENLRGKISQKRQEDPYAANILDAEYDFFKRLFKGKEFIVDGLTWEELQTRIKKDKPVAEKQKSYQIGQIVTISDNDTRRPGILLRPSPNGPIYTDSKAVFDQDDIQILEGPFVIKHQTWDQQGKPIFVDINWWKVKIIYQPPNSSQLVGSQYGEKGWISEEWFGEIQK